MADHSLLKQREKLSQWLLAVSPALWFIAAVNLHTWSSWRLEVILGNSLAQSRSELKEKLFG